jgi:DNA-binding response OmpR family regulator
MDRDRILVVEDDLALASVIRSELERAYDVRVAHTGRDALALAAEEPFHLVVLDLNLPDIDGLDVAEQLKAYPATILMLTARADVRSRVAGLYAGAGDYLAKPFEMEELLARVYAQLRRRQSDDVHHWGPLTLSPVRRTCTVHGDDVELTALEYGLLELLLTAQGRVFAKDTIIDRLYEDDVTPAHNAVEAIVSRLRAKLTAAGAEGVIENIRGLGYVVRERR